jgi:enoyl-CoA hydratase
MDAQAAIAVISTEQLSALAQSPLTINPCSPFSDRPLLLCDLGTPSSDWRSAAAWLRQLPCPVLGIAGDAQAPLARACDIWLPDLAAASDCIDNIRRRPLAAAILVQLLRFSETLPLADALQAESLAYATLQGGAEFQAWLAGNRSEAAATIRDDGPAVLLQRQQGTLQLTLNRPSNRNAMSVEMRDALCEALHLALADDAIERIEIDARGKCFSTGGDVSEFGSAPDTATAHLVRSLALPGRLLARCAQRTRVIVHGACIGSGIEFPAFAAQIAARPNAWFQLPELKYGLIPGAGGCVSIARRIGRQRTAWMVLSGARISAQTALAWGLVDALLDSA